MKHKIILSIFLFLFINTLFSQNENDSRPILSDSSSIEIFDKYIVEKVRLLNQEGKHQEAAEILENAAIEEEKKSIPDTSLIVYYYFGAGIAYNAAELYDEQKKVLEHILSKYRNNTSNDFLERIHFALSKYYKNIKQFESAIYHLNKTLQMCNSKEDSLGLYSYLANLYKENGDTTNAIQSFDLSLEKIRKIDDNKLIKKILEGGGVFYREMRDTNRTIGVINELVSFCSKECDKKDLAMSYVQLANAYKDFGYINEAKNNFDTVIKLYYELKDTSSVGWQLLFLAQTYFKNNQYDEAVEYGKDALKIAYSFNDLHLIGESFTLLMMSSIYIYDKSLINKETDTLFEYAESIGKRNEKIQIMEILNTGFSITGNNIGRIKVLEDLVQLYQETDNKKQLANTYTILSNVYILLNESVEKIVEIARKSLTLSNTLKDTVGMIYAYKTMGNIYSNLNNYKEAISQLQTALRLSFNINDSLQAANIYSELGVIYYIIGNYKFAEDFYKKSLSIKPTIGALNNYGLLFNDFGMYENALDYSLKSLALGRREGIIDLSPTLNNIGNAYEKMGKFEKAIEYYEQSLTLLEKLSRHDKMMVVLHNLERVSLILLDITGNENYYEIWKQYFKKLSSIYTSDKITSFNLDEMLSILIDYGYEYYLYGGEEYYIPDGQSLNAKKHILTACNLVFAAVNKGRSIPKLEGRAYSLLGKYYLNEGKIDSSIEMYNHAIYIYENHRKTIYGDKKRDYLATVINIYKNLTKSYFENEDYNNVFNSIELSRAKLLTEQLAKSDSLVSIPDLIEVQSSLSSNQAIVIYANVGWENLIEMVITNDTIISIEVPDSVLLATLYPDNEDATIELAIKSYRNFIKFFAETEKLAEFGRVFFDYLINPLDEHIQNKTDLLIIPDGILGYLPFEVFVDKNGQYLMEKYNITYAQSVSVWDLIRNRKYDQEQGTLLAVGGAVYNTQTYEVDMVKNDKMLAYLEKTTFDSISTRGSLRKSYASLGYSDWPNLPGSLEEINSISGVIEYTDKVVGDNATEETIKELSTSGELSKYNMLHFATHSIVVSDMPELSAVVLSQFEDELNSEDGYLTMGEIAELDIKADFVNLSACETGLGKIYSGEGVVGLTQAFMLAGANSVSVSLWPIADKATSEFMLSVYSKIAEGEDYSESITNTKREFISGLYGEKYKHPYYWAPFVYYGN
jgi:CHAT domain-containing protein/Tfp pilus assembly protein PilF